MIPKLKIQPAELTTIGNFTFTHSHTVLDPVDFEPYKKISFNYPVDIPGPVNRTCTNEEIAEAYAERLKQDFKSFILGPIK